MIPRPGTRGRDYTDITDDIPVASINLIGDAIKASRSTTYNICHISGKNKNVRPRTMNPEVQANAREQYPMWDKPPPLVEYKADRAQDPT